MDGVKTRHSYPVQDFSLYASKVDDRKLCHEQLNRYSTTTNAPPWSLLLNWLSPHTVFERSR